MILLKDIVKSIIKEGPEGVYGFGFQSTECVGPLLIFKDDAGEIHYALAYKSSGAIAYDEGEISKDLGLAATHGIIVNDIRKRWQIDVGRHDYDKTIHGRLWEIQGKYYIATWNTIEQIKAFGLSGFMDKLKELMQNEIGVSNTSKIYINPFPSDINRNVEAGYVTGDIIPFNDFTKAAAGSSADSEEALRKQKIDRMMHTMDSSIKNKLMQAKGIPTKVGDIPDWKKKAAMGIDENI